MTVKTHTHTYPGPRANTSLNRSECLVYVWISVSVHIITLYIYSNCLDLEGLFISPFRLLDPQYATIYIHTHFVLSYKQSIFNPVKHQFIQTKMPNCTIFFILNFYFYFFCCQTLVSAYMIHLFSFCCQKLIFKSIYLVSACVK